MLIDTRPVSGRCFFFVVRRVHGGLQSFQFSDHTPPNQDWEADQHSDGHSCVHERNQYIVMQRLKVRYPIEGIPDMGWYVYKPQSFPVKSDQYFDVEIHSSSDLGALDDPHYWRQRIHPKSTHRIVNFMRQRIDPKPNMRKVSSIQTTFRNRIIKYRLSADHRIRMTS